MRGNDEAGEVVGRGRWCLVRRDLRTRAILTHALGDGTALRHGTTVLHG